MRLSRFSKPPAPPPPPKSGITPSPYPTVEPVVTSIFVALSPSPGRTMPPCPHTFDACHTTPNKANIAVGNHRQQQTESTLLMDIHSGAMLPVPLLRLHGVTEHTGNAGLRPRNRLATKIGPANEEKGRIDRQAQSHSPCHDRNASH